MVQVAEEDGVGFRLVATVRIVSETGIRGRSLGKWMNMYAFVAVPPYAVVVSSHSRRVEASQLRDEGSA